MGCNVACHMGPLVVGATKQQKHKQGSISSCFRCSSCSSLHIMLLLPPRCMQPLIKAWQESGRLKCSYQPSTEANAIAPAAFYEVDGDAMLAPPHTCMCVILAWVVAGLAHHGNHQPESICCSFNVGCSNRSTLVGTLMRRCHMKSSAVPIGGALMVWQSMVANPPICRGMMSIGSLTEGE